jgi:uncharacterized membrane protein YeaQ/YmgE (transglycosylase-associated protein family)
MVWYILGLLLVGLIAGAIARLFISSPERLGCLGTAVLGVVGSYAGGSLGAVIFDDKFDLRKASSFVGAIVGSMVILGVWRLIAGARRRR